MIPDYHIHTAFSIDSQAPMAAMCRTALDKGLSEIGITEHYDLHPGDSGYRFFRAEAWWKELQRCREIFNPALTIRAGIEVGEPHRHAAEVDAMLASFPWDYAIGGLHWIADRLIFSPQYFQQPEGRAYKAYLRELLTMTQEGAFDVLAHFDIVKRYGHEFYGRFEPKRYEDEIRRVLQTCVHRGLALEINTSPLRRPVDECSPSQTILAWYVEEGGNLLTFGSDAHLTEHVGYGFERALRAAQRAGLENLSRYVQRKPCPLPLPTARSGL